MAYKEIERCCDGKPLCPGCLAGEDDCAWFDRHPNAVERVRKPFVGEIEQHSSLFRQEEERMTDIQDLCSAYAAGTARVRVLKMRGNKRARLFFVVS
jgi:hypothetical protein